MKVALTMKDNTMSIGCTRRMKYYTQLLLKLTSFVVISLYLRALYVKTSLCFCLYVSSHCRIFQQIHIQNTTHIHYKWYMCDCDLSIIKVMSLEEQCNFSVISQLPKEEFSSKFTSWRVQTLDKTIYVWMWSLNDEKHFTRWVKGLFGSTSAPTRRIFLKVHACNATHILYKRPKFGRDQSIIKGTFQKQWCPFSAVSWLPLERFSWKLMSVTLHTFITYIVSRHFT
jgi:hypothetical protein